MMCLWMRVRLGFWGLRRFEDEVLGSFTWPSGRRRLWLSSLGSLHGIDGYATTLLRGSWTATADYDIVLRGALKMDDLGIKTRHLR